MQNTPPTLCQWFKAIWNSTEGIGDVARLLIRLAGSTNIRAAVAVSSCCSKFQPLVYMSVACTAASIYHKALAKQVCISLSYRNQDSRGKDNNAGDLYIGASHCASMKWAKPMNVIMALCSMGFLRQALPGFVRMPCRVATLSAA